MQNYQDECLDEFMGECIRDRLKHCGENVKIYPLAKIVKPEVIEIGDNSIISDFTFIDGGKGITIGKYVHISHFTSVIGGGKLEMGDFSGCAAGCRLLTGTDDYSGRSLTNPSVPEKYKPFLVRGEIIMGNYSILGSNTVVNPDVRIEEGAATIVNSLVTKDLQPWTIYGGSPARKIKERSKEMTELSKELSG